MRSLIGSYKGGNEGIQGNVVADVLAVGRNASAHKTVTMGDGQQLELTSALKQLHDTLSGLALAPGAHQALAADVSLLHTASTAKEPDRSKVESILGSITGKLKMLGDTTKGVVDLIEPLGKIAGIFHLSLAALGLL